MRVIKGVLGVLTIAYIGSCKDWDPSLEVLIIINRVYGTFGCALGPVYGNHHILSLPQEANETLQKSKKGKRLG